MKNPVLAHGPIPELLAHGPIRGGTFLLNFRGAYSRGNQNIAKFKSKISFLGAISRKSVHFVQISSNLINIKYWDV